MAVGGIGLLKTPVDIAAKMGKVCDTFSADMSVLRKVKDSLNTDERSNVIGEFAFGINSKARFVEEFLESEKMLGTIHMAFGNNSDMPSGQNKSRNHMDFMFSNPTVKVFNRDGNSFTVLADGIFQNP
jgi:leucyl aminopeptidase (aminopeptidase T)